ncbi:uncharacterized protein LOC130623619 [Hydractinia symbiolongicarpus]|uniref:uncharacterized protein LOC130623619 n=1 Tax=Hydractinia symbiolongicarpus TaxID=13093 RepID=UPI00254F4993|nr:uncharacterized protein LOC130623619 [Hydractinia symbiolongicarpus]
MKYNCQFCEHTSVCFKWLIKHMWDFHSLSQKFAVVCGVSSCIKKFRNEKSFLRHLKLKHGNFYLNHMKRYTTDFPEAVGTSKQTEDDVNYETLINKDANEVELDDTCFDDVSECSPLSLDFDSIIADILVELRERYYVTQNAVSFICEKVCNILRIDREVHKKQIVNSLYDNPGPLIHEETKIFLDCESPFKKSLDRFRNGTVLTNFVAKKPEYVAPSEVFLGYSDSGSKETMQEIDRSISCIFKTLKSMLCHEDVLGEVLQPVTVECQNGRLNRFSDGSLHQANSLFSHKPNALQIVLYHDDFQVANPLGNKTHKCKVSGFYLILGNLKPEHRSRLKDIQLALLCNASLVKKYGYKTVLHGDHCPGMSWNVLEFSFCPGMSWNVLDFPSFLEIVLECPGI